MKFALATLVSASFLAISMPATAHMEHGQPQYGGIFGEAGTFQMELVSHDHKLTLYVTVHGEPLSTKGASGKLTILDADGKTEVTLAPAGENQLVAKLRTKPAAGSKVVANVSLPGKSPANVRFAID